MSGESKVLIVMMGLPSSGKSTIANLLAKELTDKYEFPSIVIGTDDVRRLIPSQMEEFDPSKEPFIKSSTLNSIQFGLENNYLVINDDMNYYKSMRHELMAIAEKNQAHFLLLHVEIPLETALEWNEKRGLPIPQEVIRKVFDRFDRPGDYQWDTPLVVIQADKISPEVAVQEILVKLLPVIQSPLIPKSAPPPTKPGLSEEIDKLTRNIVAQIAQKEKDPTILKKVSKFRIKFTKDPQNKEIPIEKIKEDFLQMLTEYISDIKQAK